MNQMQGQMQQNGTRQHDAAWHAGSDGHEPTDAVSAELGHADGPAGPNARHGHESDAGPDATERPRVQSVRWWPGLAAAGRTAVACAQTSCCRHTCSEGAYLTARASPPGPL